MPQYFNCKGAFLCEEGEKAEVGHSSLKKTSRTSVSGLGPLLHSHTHSYCHAEASTSPRSSPRMP